MKKVFWLLTMFALSLSSVSTQAALSTKNPGTNGGKATTGDGIQFTEASWKEVLKKAKAEKKLIFLDAYTTWCGPCKMLQKQVFTKKEVGDVYNNKFINVKIDMEKGEGPALAQAYPIEGYPTLMFIDGNGRIVKKFLGALPAEQLISIGKSIKSPVLQ